MSTKSPKKEAQSKKRSIDRPPQGGDSPPANYSWHLDPTPKPGESLYRELAGTFRLLLLALDYESQFDTYPALVSTTKILKGIWLALSRGDRDTLRAWEKPVYEYLRTLENEYDHRTMPDGPDGPYGPDFWRRFNASTVVYFSRSVPRANLDRKDAIGRLLTKAEILARGGEVAEELLFWPPKYRSIPTDAPYHDRVALFMYESAVYEFPQLIKSRAEDAGYSDGVIPDIAASVMEAMETIHATKRARRFVVVTLRGLGLSKAQVDNWLKGVPDERS